MNLNTILLADEVCSRLKPSLKPRL